MTSSSKLREAINQAKADHHDDIMTHHDEIMTHHATYLPTYPPTNQPTKLIQGKSKSLPSEARDLSKLLYTLHHDNIDIGYNVSEASLSKWATSIEKINRLDSRSWADIESAIRWIKTPGQFWAANIMSGAKLREKFPTIWGQMKRGNGQSPRVNQRSAFLDMEE